MLRTALAAACGSHRRHLAPRDEPSSRGARRLRWGEQAALRRILAAFCLIGFLTPGGAPAAEPPSSGLRGSFAELFESGWQRSPAARDRAAEQYQLLRQAAPDDSRIPFAYALVQVYQYRYADAAKLFDEVLAEDRQNLTAVKVRIWLAMLLKDFDVALSGVRHLNRMLPDKDAPGDAERPYYEAVDLMGRVCGYLSGPAGDPVFAGRADQTAQAVAARLTSTRRSVFEESRQAVIGASTQAAQDVDATRTAEVSSAVAQKEQQLMVLDRQGQQLASDTAAAQQRLEKVREELEDEMAEIRKRDQQLVMQLGRVEAEAAHLRHEAIALENRIADLLAAAEEAEDPLRRQRYVDEANHWRFRLDRIVLAGRQMDRQLRALSAERMKLQQQGAAAGANYEHELRMAQNVHQAAQRVAAQQQKVAAEPINPNTGRVRAKKKRAVAFRTYVPLPINLEEEKRKLLESL